MNLAIDIDDTLTNTKDLQKVFWEEYIINNPNSNYTKELPSNINAYGEEYIDVFWDTYRFRLFESPFKENASIILNKLASIGYNIYIVTARREEKYPNLKQKITTSLKANNIPFKEILTSIDDKGKCMKDNNLDILIDDELFNIESALKYNKKVILFNNIENFNGMKTTNWLDIYDIIINMEGE